MIDRAAQKAGRTYSGVACIATQSTSGPIQDRSNENLVSIDNAIIMARIRLRKAALGLQSGGRPLGLSPERHRARSASFVLRVGEPFARVKADVLKAREGVPHNSI